jgi:hypothetical protein
MAEDWWEKRVDSEIRELRQEIRGLQDLVLRGAIAFCIVVQLIAFLILAVSAGR